MALSIKAKQRFIKAMAKEAEAKEWIAELEAAANGPAPLSYSRQPVKFASTTGNGPIILNGLQSVDGQATTAGDRVLLTDQSGFEHQNGVWIVSSGAWTRADDFNSEADFVLGASVLVLSGTNAGKEFYVSTAPAILDTNVIAFSQKI